jgi:hypothetical protein
MLSMKICHVDPLRGSWEMQQIHLLRVHVREDHRYEFPYYQRLAWAAGMADKSSPFWEKERTPLVVVVCSLPTLVGDLNQRIQIRHLADSVLAPRNLPSGRSPLATALKTQNPRFAAAEKYP